VREVKSLIIKIIVLLLPFALTLAFVEYELRQIPNSYSATKADLEKELPDVEVLVLGSSHTRAAIKTEHLARKAFNLANGSQSLHYDTQLVAKYFDEMKNLKLVIFTISYFSLEYRLNMSIERWRAGFYRQVYQIPGEDGQQLDLSDYSYIALYTPKEAYSFVLQRLRSGRASTGADEGREREINIVGGVDDADGKKRLQLHHSMMYKNNLQGNLDALEQIITRLKEKQIAVVLLTTPVHPTYSNHILPAKYQEMQEHIGRLCEKYDLRYFNYMYDQRFSTEDYANSDHLNPAGAEKFSKVINEDILKKYIHP
jgi:hypothetical protein